MLSLSTGLRQWHQTMVPDTIFLTSTKTLHKLPFSSFGWQELLFSYHLFAKLASTSSSQAIYCIITSQTIPKLYNFSETSYGIAVYVCFQRPIHQFHERKMWKRVLHQISTITYFYWLQLVKNENRVYLLTIKSSPVLSV